MRPAGCRILGVAEPARSRISISAEFLHQQRCKLGSMLFVGAALGTPPMPVICGRETAIEEAATDQRRITRHPAIAVFRNCVAAVLIARDPHPPSPTQSPHRGGAGEPIAFQRPAPGPASTQDPSAACPSTQPSMSAMEPPRSVSGARDSRPFRCRISVWRNHSFAAGFAHSASCSRCPLSTSRGTPASSRALRMIDEILFCGAPGSRSSLERLANRHHTRLHRQARIRPLLSGVARVR